jgi:hypothetical protein
MAQTRKRRRKHRGTQGGRIDTRRAKPRTRAEARAQAKSSRGSSKKGRGKGKASAQRGRREPGPPTWRGATTRGLVAAGVFLVIMLGLFKRTPLQSFSLSAFMLAIYIPLGFFIDGIIYQRRQRQKRRESEKKTAEKAGG